MFFFSGRESSRQYQESGTRNTLTRKRLASTFYGRVAVVVVVSLSFFGRFPFPLEFFRCPELEKIDLSLDR